MSLCQIEERDAGRSYPRTCPTCKLSACVRGLDRASLLARIVELEQTVKTLEQSCSEWADVSQSNYQRARTAEAALRDIAAMSIVCASDRAAVALKQFVALDSR